MTARAKWRCTCILGLVLVVGGALAPAAWTATAAQAPHAPSPEVEPVAVDDAAQPNGAAAPHAPTVHAQGTHAQGSHFQDQQTQDRQAGSGTAANSEAGALPPIDACAAKPDVLGLSRVVEVDTANGPVFGGSHKGNNFLADGEVILTFDDGPMRAYTRQVLKALADHCTKATFFMVGRMAVADPAMVKEVAAAGHTVASHTWSHQNLKALGVAKGTKEFELGASAVSAALGTPSAPFFRFPYLNEGKHVADHLKDRNTASFFIDVDSKDYLTRDPKKMHDKIMGQLMAQRKGIILMHDIQPSTAHGIARLLDTLHAKGFKIVHMVAKAPTETVAEYDAEANRLIAAKFAGKKGKPLADRAILWSAEPPKAAAGARARPTPTAPAKPTAASKVSTSTTAGDARSGEQLPWQGNAAQPAAPSTARKPAAANEDQPWQMRLFQH